MITVIGILGIVVVIGLAPVLLVLAAIRTIFDVLIHGTKALKDNQ